jgi:hypothetical protein
MTAYLQLSRDQVLKNLCMSKSPILRIKIGVSFVADRAIEEPGIFINNR